MDQEYRLQLTMNKIRPIIQTLGQIDIMREGYLRRYEAKIGEPISARDYPKICMIRKTIVKNQLYAQRRTMEELCRDIAIAIMKKNDKMNGHVSTDQFLKEIEDKKAGLIKPIPKIFKDEEPAQIVRELGEGIARAVEGNSEEKISNMIQSLRKDSSQSLNKQEPQSLEADDSQSLGEDDDEDI